MWSRLLHSYVPSCGPGWRVGNEANQTVHWKDHIVCSAPWPGLHALWPVSFVLLVHGIYRKQTATDGFLKIKCWLSLRDWQFTSSLPPDSRRWWINTAGSNGRGGICNAEAWGHNQCNHRAPNVASISRLMDSINKRPLVLYPLFSMYSFSAITIILT